MKITHRIKKNLHGLYGFERLDTGEREYWSEQLGLLSGDQICGLYRNSSDCDTELLLVTLDGLYIKSGDEWEFLGYRDMQSIKAPSKEPKDRELLIGLKSGKRLRLPITGGRDRFKDVYGFVRFLRSAPGDQR